MHGPYTLLRDRLGSEVSGWSFGFRFWILGFWVWALGLGFDVWDLGLIVRGAEVRRCRGYSSIRTRAALGSYGRLLLRSLRVQGSGVWGVGFMRDEAALFDARRDARRHFIPRSLRRAPDGGPACPPTPTPYTPNPCILNVAPTKTLNSNPERELSGAAILSHSKCLYSRFAKVNSRTNPSTYSLHQ